MRGEGSPSRTDDLTRPPVAATAKTNTQTHTGMGGVFFGPRSALAPREMRCARCDGGAPSIYDERGSPNEVASICVL